jgi:hypothetical protein
MIFPVDTSGAVVIRDELGNPTNPPNVQNAFVPAPGYVITCPPTALPSDCTARITAAQINAIVSELLSFAECLDPDGPWDCASLKNLCAAFEAWKEAGQIVVGEDPPPLPPSSPFWFESDTGLMYFYYDDGNTQQFVQIGGVVVDDVTIVGMGIAGDPLRVGAIDCGVF